MEKFCVSAVSEWKGVTPYVHVSVEAQDGKAVTNLKQSHFNVRELTQGLLPIIVKQFLNSDADGGFYTLAIARDQVHGHGAPWTFEDIKNVVFAVEVTQMQYPPKPTSSHAKPKAVKKQPIVKRRGQALAILQL
jgi:hypothetical protein